jgi:glycosyltransferase involved in cell wall biosynthesis
MRILQVADVSIASDVSGSERVLYEQSTCLAKRGHEVHLLTRRLPFHKSSKEKISGVYEWRYNFQGKLPLPFLRSIFVNCRHSFISLQKESFSDIINFHQPFSATGVLSSSAASGIPLIYTCLSFSFEEYASRTEAPTKYREWMLFRLQLHCRKLLEKRALTRSDKVVVLSEYTKRKLEKTYSLSPLKINLIPGGVDLDRFRPQADKQAVRRSLGISDSHFVPYSCFQKGYGE